MKQVTESQLYLGRSLAPLGIVGPRHEPPLFFGVERPNVEKYILPSTWSVDGVGLNWRSYQKIFLMKYMLLEVLDASGFSTTMELEVVVKLHYPRLRKSINYRSS